jgi:histone acetyltransferase (RNA polymerase elongator complex component)
MAKNQVTIPLFVPHQGCPHQCAFCNQWTASGAKGIPFPQDIKSIIGEHLKHIRPGVSRVEAAFFGGSFTGMDFSTQERLLGAALPFLEKGLIQGIRLSTRPDYIDAERLDLLQLFHVDTVELGAQSFCDEVLAASRRGHNAGDIFRASRMIIERGMNLVIQLMPGLPQDTRERSLESAAAAIKTSPSAVRIYPTVVMRGTELERMHSCGQYSPLSMNEAIDTVKDMYSLFNGNHVKVIRMGLHPLAPGEEDSIISGPYHPAFGFLVKARLRRDELVLSVNKETDAGRGAEGTGVASAVITIPRAAAEEYIGHRAENMDYLKKLFHFDSLRYRVEDIEEPRVQIRRMSH